MCRSCRLRPSRSKLACNLTSKKLKTVGKDLLPCCVFSREKNDAFDSVIATCKELSIPIIAYSYVLVTLFFASCSPQTALLVADYSPARSRTRRTCLKATLGECSVASKMRYATLLDFGSPADTTHSHRPLRITASLWIP